MLISLVMLNPSMTMMKTALNIVKDYKTVQLFMDNPTQSYEASPAIWDHIVTCHTTQVNVHHLNPGQIGQYLIYLT